MSANPDFSETASSSNNTVQARLVILRAALSAIRRISTDSACVIPKLRSFGPTRSGPQDDTSLSVSGRYQQNKLVRQ